MDSPDFAAVNVPSDVLASQRAKLYELVVGGTALGIEFALAEAYSTARAPTSTALTTSVRIRRRSVRAASMGRYTLTCGILPQARTAVPARRSLAYTATMRTRLSLVIIFTTACLVGVSAAPMFHQQADIAFTIGTKQP